MKLANLPDKRTLQTDGSARFLLLGGATIALGLALGAIWFQRPSGTLSPIISPTTETKSSAERLLTPATLEILRDLTTPVEVRYYAILDPLSALSSQRQLAERVANLLAAYERSSAGKIQIQQFVSRTNFDAEAAVKEGITPFNRDKGEACYLGIVVACQGKKKAFPRLATEWEQALESDLSRAIAQVMNDAAQAKSSPFAPPPIDSTALDEVRRKIPNLASISVEDGTKILRADALDAFKVTGQQMETKIREAEQRYQQATNGASATEVQLATKQLQQAQADRVEKLKQIAANSAAQIEALRQIKSAKTTPE